MKAKELAEQLMENPDFDVEFGLLEEDGSQYGMLLRTFSVRIDDIGYSDSVIKLGAVEESDNVFCQSDMSKCDLFSLDFEDNTITFEAPKGVLEKGVHAGTVLIDFSGIIGS